MKFYYLAGQLIIHGSRVVSVPQGPSDTMWYTDYALTNLTVSSQLEFSAHLNR